jgi:hypothetical protein
MKLLLLFGMALAAFAADISGNWKGSAEGPNGAIERSFVFKAEGAKFTGETVSQFTGKSEIADGKIDGDNLSFSIKAKFQDNEMTLTYKGKVVSADEITLSSEFGGSGQTIEWKLARVK